MGGLRSPRNRWQSLKRLVRLWEVQSWPTNGAEGESVDAEGDLRCMTFSFIRWLHFSIFSCSNSSYFLTSPSFSRPRPFILLLIFSFSSHSDLFFLPFPFPLSLFDPLGTFNTLSLPLPFPLLVSSYSSVSECTLCVVRRFLLSASSKYFIFPKGRVLLLCFRRCKCAPISCFKVWYVLVNCK